MLIKFLPHSGEYAYGYRGRLASANLARNPTQLLKKLSDEMGVPLSVSEAHLLEGLAYACGMSVVDFCRQHSMVPFLRLVAASQFEIPHGGTSPDTGRMYNIKREDREGLFCEACMKEQMAQYGYSYWQRDLQIPAICYCPIHGIELWRVSQCDFSKSPHLLQVEAKLVLDGQVVDRDIIDRYSKIANGMFEFTHPVSKNEATNRLGRRAMELGLRIDFRGPKKSLNDVAKDRLPQEWAMRYFPDLAKEGDSGSNLLSAMIYGPNPLTAVLALALMFDTAEQALQYWSASYSEFRVPLHGSNVLGSGMPESESIDSRQSSLALMAVFSGVPIQMLEHEFGLSSAEIEDLLMTASARFGQAMKAVTEHRLSPNRHNATRLQRENTGQPALEIS